MSPMTYQQPGLVVRSPGAGASNAQIQPIRPPISNTKGDRMMLTELQKKTTHAIVNIFETGSAHGHYAQVTLMSGDTGHLTYGRSQRTLAENGGAIIPH